MIRTFRYPLRPNDAQAATLGLYITRCRTLYNAALEQRKEAYRKQGKTLTKYDQQKELAQLRQNNSEFAIIPSVVLRSALNNLDLAYKAFFRRVKSGETPGFPRFKGRDRYRSFRLLSHPSIKDSKILIPKLGYIRFHQYRPLKGIPLDASIRKDSSGRWYISIQCDLGEAPAKLAPQTHIGIDVGLTNFATLSNGEKTDNPRFFRESEELLASRQQSLSLKKKGSSSRLRQKKLVAKAYEHIRNQRLDFARKLAALLFARFDLISYEDLNIAGLAAGMLSKSVNDAGWGLLINCITNKAEEAGKWAVGVDPRGTSQRCSQCGEEPLIKKLLSDREHNCASCGLSLDRDHNAAINIDALGMSAVEEQLARVA